ncbi:Protein of unknown function [Gryllus bimaculatus]|nr:Protein of unknown function [Gryllus bimaculatus]
MLKHLQQQMTLRSFLLDVRKGGSVKEYDLIYDVDDEGPLTEIVQLLHLLVGMLCCRSELKVQMERWDYSVKWLSLDN